MYKALKENGGKYDYTYYTTGADGRKVANKETIKANYEEILSDRYNKGELHKMSTSGSTGTPFEILQNKEKRQRVLAELIYFNSIMVHPVLNPSK